MNVDSRAEAWVSLQLSSVAPRPLVDLLRAFGSPESVLGATSSQLRGVVTLAQAKAIEAKPAPDRLRATLNWLARRSTASSRGTTPIIRARSSKSAILPPCSTAWARAVF